MKIVKLSLVLLLLSLGIKAQITSSGMTGKVTDPKGEGIPGAVVQATHLTTGTNYPTMTDAKGIYHLVNLIPGGPYTLKITFLGYQDNVQENLMAPLGENVRLDVKMAESAQQLGEVTVITDKDDSKSGAGTRISKDQILVMPSLSRSMSDFTRLTPQSSNNSFAGTNFRYNNITIDGAVSNDAIGFSPSNGGISGTSNMLSSSTRTNAMSLDAISDIAVSISPYDVKMGNFTGGSINAVTRRGTNDLSGSVYGFGRGGFLTGPDNAGDKSAMPSSYHDIQAGFRIGGAFIKNKLFAFMNYEKTDRSEPNFYMPGSNGTFMTTAIANQITDSLQSSHFMPTSIYNPNGTYDPGNITSYSIFSRSDKIFTRLDYNLSDKHQISLRNNTVMSSASNLEQSANLFQFGNYDFVQNNFNTATVAELKSRFNDKTSNSLILGATMVHDYRDVNSPNNQQLFPQVQINGVNGTGTVLLGSNREAGIFNMKQNTYEFTDNFTWFKGRHTFTAGTHNEYYQIHYGFINSWNGRIDYSSLANFIANKPSRIRSIYNLTDNSKDNNTNNPVEDFNVFMGSAYVQDEWAIMDNLKVTPGVRVDMTMLPNNPIQSPSVTGPNNVDYSATSTYNHTPITQLSNKLLGQPMISPRLGFNWDVMSNKKIIVRGGSGLFTGRIPFAWLGYAYYNNGTTYGAFDYKPAGVVNIPTDPTQFQALNTNVFKQPNRVEVDLIDNNFKLPQVWRSNMAVDLNFKGYKLTLEGMYSQVINDVKFQQINLKDSVKYYTQDVNHYQPVYLSGGPNKNRINDGFSSSYLLSNTNQGYRYQLTAQLSKQYAFGLNFMAAYTYGESKDIQNGIRNSMESSWQTNQAGSPNNLSLAYSNFDIRHRIVSLIGYKKTWKKNMATYATLVLSMQSGSPYTWGITTNNKLTNNGQQVDMFYIPAQQSDINLIQYVDANGVTQTPTMQWAALDNLISNDPYLSKHRGEYTTRNGARTPWNNTLDLRLMHDFNIFIKEKKHTFQLTLDVINLTNLLNPNWGWVYFVPNTINQTVSVGLTPLGTTTNGNPNFNFSAPTTTPYSLDKLNSRWQGQIGVRYLF